MRTIFLLALICGVLALMLQSTNAGPPPQMSPTPSKGGPSAIRARRAAQGPGGGGEAGAGGGFGFGMSAGAGAGGKAGAGGGK